MCTFVLASCVCTGVCTLVSGGGKVGEKEEQKKCEQVVRSGVMRGVCILVAVLCASKVCV